MRPATPTSFTCPTCQAEVVVPIRSTLNQARDVLARRLVLERRLHREPCPGCGKGLTVETEFLYVDLARGHWVCVLPYTDRPHLVAAEAAAQSAWRQAFRDRKTPPAVRAWGEQAPPRLVFGLDELREKVLAAEHGLDDGVLEVLKEELMIRDAAWTTVDALLLEAVRDDGTLLLCAPGEPERRILVHPDIYAELARHRDSLVARRPALFERPWRNLQRYRVDDPAHAPSRTPSHA